MKVIWVDGRPMDEVLEEWEKERAKKNFRNWLDNKYPNGILGVPYAPFWTLTHPWQIIRWWRLHIRWAWQRVFRGWDDRATWGLDYYLAEIIPPILEEIKKKGGGIPISMFDGLSFEDEDMCAYSNESMAIAEKRFVNMLDSIIEPFSKYEELNRLPWKEYDAAYAEFEKVFDILKEHYRELGD